MHYHNALYTKLFCICNYLICSLKWHSMTKLLFCPFSEHYMDYSYPILPVSLSVSVSIPASDHVIFVNLSKRSFKDIYNRKSDMVVLRALTCFNACSYVGRLTFKYCMRTLIHHTTQTLCGKVISGHNICIRS